MNNHSGKRRGRIRLVAFSLVELLVLIGIVAVLIALLVPALAQARKSALAITCASNLRQLSTALLNYAAQSNGFFPANDATHKMYWYNNAAIGRYIGGTPTPDTAQHIGGVLLCPAELEGTVRCYSMNTFASSGVNPAVEAVKPPRGKLFTLGAGQSSKLILLVEAYAYKTYPEGTPEPSDFYTAPALAGFFPPLPGRRLGALGGAMIKSDRFGTFASQVCYYRHRTAKQSAGLGDPIGRVNIAFLDGHVSIHRHDELYDAKTGHSTYLALWSELDSQLE